MAKAKKLPSGSWRILIFLGKDENGKQIRKSITAPTKKEAEMQAALLLMEKEKAQNDTSLEVACHAYIESKRHVLSPSTESEYEKMISRSFSSILHYRLDDITLKVIQSWVNKRAAKCSRKTIENELHFLGSVLKQNGIYIHSEQLTLPQKKKIEPHMPSAEDVRKIMEAGDGDYKVAMLLATFGPMRRSEICALEPRDIEGNYVHVTKAIVKDKNRNWVLKDPKTYSSTRTIEFPDFVIKAFKRHGKIKVSPDAITHQHAHILKRLGIRHFRFHDYRHYGASVLHALGMPDKYIMQRGGWSSQGTLERIYKHALDEISQKENAKANAYFEKHFTTE